MSAALHLAQLEADTGTDAGSLVTELETKFEGLKTLKAEVLQITKDKEKAAAELDAINKAKAAAQEEYNTQTAKLKAKLVVFMIENMVSWDKVKTALAVLKNGLTDSGWEKKR